MSKYSLIHIEDCQIKSFEKAELLCELLDKLEKEFGIREVEISFKGMFVCPDIDLTALSNSGKPMHELVGRLLIKLDRIKYGKKSKYEIA
jgi:hypothetical protein